MIALSMTPSPASAEEAGGVAPDAGILQGQVKMKGACAKGEHMIWVSKGRSLYYQAEVVSGSTFEFHLLPGTYDVVVNSSQGCLAEMKARVEKGGRTPMALTLAVPQKTTKRDPASAKRGRHIAFVAAPNACYWCRSHNQNTFFMPSFAQYDYPWWYNYGAMAYGNYAHPAMWNGGGYAPRYYPRYSNAGYHGIAAGKPNIYVSGPEGTQATVELKLREKASWLASVPAYDAKGWNVTIAKGNRLKDSTSVQSYLFADYLIDEEGMQGEEGFCAERNGLISAMAIQMAKTGFHRGEIRDFKAYWEYKMPPASRYCVYPQMNAQLSKNTSLETTPAAAKVTRLLFVVRPDPQLYPRDGVFSDEPKKAWVSPVAAAESRGRGPAGTSSLEVREWGVGFVGSRP